MTDLLSNIRASHAAGPSLRQFIAGSTAGGLKFLFRLKPVLFAVALLTTVLDVNVIGSVGDGVVVRLGSCAAPGVRVAMRRFSRGNPRSLQMVSMMRHGCSCLVTI